MLNIINLEKRWLRYKIKSYIPHATVIVTFIIIGIFVSIILNSPTVANKKVIVELKPVLDDKTIEPTITSISKIQIPKQEAITNIPSNTKLQPSLSFMTDIENANSSYNQTNIPSPIRKISTKIKRKKIIKKTSIIKEAIPKIIEEQIPEKKETKENIVIQRKETKDDINNVIKRFKTNNNPALSLFIAKKYYEIGNYHQAYNYSFITNQINSEIELSWIIFSKSLVKLHKKEKAIQTLKQYIKSTDSSSAKLLLDEIQSGRFR